MVKLSWAKAVSMWNKMQPWHEDLYGIPRKNGDYYDEVKEIMGVKVKKPEIVEKPIEDRRAELLRELRGTMIGNNVINPQEYERITNELENLDKKKDDRMPKIESENISPVELEKKEMEDQIVKSEFTKFTKKDFDDMINDFLSKVTKVKDTQRKFFKIDKTEYLLKIDDDRKKLTITKTAMRDVVNTHGQKVRTEPKKFTLMQTRMFKNLDFDSNSLTLTNKVYRELK